MNGRILIGGGTGFIGKELVGLFERLDYEVIVISRKKSARERQRSLELIRDTKLFRKNTKTWIDIEVLIFFQNRIIVLALGRRPSLGNSSCD